MNLSEARIVIRPRRRLESLDLAFRYVFGDAAATYALVGLFSVVPAFAVTAAARVALGWSWVAVWTLALCLGSVTSGVFTVLAGNLLFDRAHERRGGAKLSLATFARRFPSFVLAMLMSRGLIAAGWWLLIPGLLLWARYSFVAEAVLLERMPARAALSRSARLARSGADDAVASLLVLVVFIAAFVVSAEILGTSMAEDVLSIPLHTEHLFTDGGSLFALAGYFSSVPWSATGRFLAYIDGRTRQDGWDVQVKILALEASEPA